MEKCRNQLEEQCEHPRKEREKRKNGIHRRKYKKNKKK